MSKIAIFFQLDSLFSCKEAGHTQITFSFVTLSKLSNNRQLYLIQILVMTPYRVMFYLKLSLYTILWFLDEWKH